MSANEEAMIQLVGDFFKEQAQIYNQFLGKNGVEKLLCGCPLGWNSLKKIDEIVEKTIMPELNTSMDKIMKEIKDIYKESGADNGNVLK